MHLGYLLICWLISVLYRLLVQIKVGMVTVMAVVMAMMGMFHYHNLCLQCQRGCEAEDEDESEPKLFHSLLCRARCLSVELF